MDTLEIILALTAIFFGLLELNRTLQDIAIHLSDITQALKK